MAGSIDPATSTERISSNGSFRSSIWGSSLPRAPASVLSLQRSGYYLRERLLIPRPILTSLRKRVHMGLPAPTAVRGLLALKRFRLLPLLTGLSPSRSAKKRNGESSRKRGSRKTHETASLFHPEGGARNGNQPRAIRIHR